MLLHGGKSEDAIRNFFNEVYELYVKVREPRWCSLMCEGEMSESFAHSRHLNHCRKAIHESILSIRYSNHIKSIRLASTSCCKKISSVNIQADKFLSLVR